MEKERQLKVMERITLQEKRKFEMMMKQNASREFVKELKMKGAGSATKHYLARLEKKEKLKEEEEEVKEEKEEKEGEKIRYKNVGSIFTRRVIDMEKNRRREEKYKELMKKDLYRKRQAYGKHVIENFLPKINHNYLVGSADYLLKRNYR